MSAPTIEDVREEYRAATDDIWNEGNLDAIDEMYGDDMVMHDIAEGADYHGRDRFKEWAANILEAFPDLHIEMDDVLVGERKATMQWTFSGTHDGPLHATEDIVIDPTNESVRFEGATILASDGDRVTEAWWYYDMYGMLQQLGVFPGDSTG